MRQSSSGSRSRAAVLRSSWLAMLILAALLAAACGGSDDSDSTSSDSNRSGSGESADAAKSLVIGLGGDITSLDPLLVSDGQRDVVSMNVYEALTTRSIDGTIEPQLAESWTAEETTWTFKIREGVTFHDGSALTEEDVVASYRRLLDPDLQSEIGPAFMATVTDVTSNAPMEVTITTSLPDPTIANNASIIVIAPAEWADTADKRMESEMMGTGPYRFVSWDRGQRMTFERYDDYWGAAPEVEAFEVRFMPEASVRASALKAGEIDIAHNMPPDLAGQGPQVITGLLSEVMTGRLNMKAGPLQNIELRKAANLAIDRESICKQLFAGYCEVATHNVINDVFGANPDLEPYEFNPDEARKILEAEGAVGTRLSMHVPNGRWQNDRQLGEVLAAMLEDVGFVVDAQYLEIGVWLDGYFAVQEDPSGAPDIATLGTSNDSLDSSTSLNIMFSCNGSASGLCDEEIDSLIEKASATMDDGDRAAQYREIWSQLHDQFAMMPLVIVQQVHLARDGITWKPRPQVFMYVSEISVD